MPLAAIISATALSVDRPDILRGQIIFAAQTLMEYQARQATGAGARELFIMVDAVTPQLSRLVDRLIADGIQVHLIRDMPTLVRQLPRNSDILLFADGMVVDQRHIRELAQGEGDGLLLVEDSPATAHFERVDAQYRWAGVARVSPHILFNTLDLIGDWDLVLTLLRVTVQGQPRRIVISGAEVAEGRVALIDRQDTADLVARALVAPMESDEERAGAERYILGPLARFIAPRLLRLQIPPRHLQLGAGAIALLGLAVLGFGGQLLSLLLFLLALTANLVADHISHMGRIGGRHDVIRLFPEAIVLIGVVGLGGQVSSFSDGLHLALLSAITSVVVLRGKWLALPAWAYVTPGTILLVLLAALFVGVTPAALAMMAVLAIASLGAFIVLRDDRPA